MTTTTTPHRDATWAERGATLSIFLALGISVGAWAAALPGIKLRLFLSDRELSLALLAVSLGSVAATLAAGAYAPRLGTGRATAGAALALIVTLLMPALAGTLWELIPASLVFGGACGFLDVSMNGHASEVERRWGRAIMSSFHGAFSLGGLIGASLGGLLIAWGLGTIGQLGVTALLVGVLVLASLAALGPGSKGEPGEAGLAWPTRTALGLCCIALFGLMVEGAVADWAGVYLATVVKVSESAAATGYAAFSVAMAFGRLVGDHVVRSVGAKLVVIGGGLLSAAGMALSVVSHAFWPATLGFALVGLGMSNVVPTVFSAAGRMGRTPAAGMAMVVSVGYIGFISGPPLIGGLASATDLRTALGLLVVVSASLVVPGLFLQPGKSR